MIRTKGEPTLSEIHFFSDLQVDEYIRLKASRSGGVRGDHHDPIIGILNERGPYHNKQNLKIIPERSQYPFLDRQGNFHATMKDVWIANNAIFDNLLIQKTRELIPNTLDKYRK